MSTDTAMTGKKVYRKPAGIARTRVDSQRYFDKRFSTGTSERNISDTGVFDNVIRFYIHAHTSAGVFRTLPIR